jgi:hypothetical protein
MAQANCGLYSISTDIPTPANFSSDGGDGSFRYLAVVSNSCFPALWSDSPWLTITTAQDNNPNGTGTYHVAPNPTTSTRQGHIFLQEDTSPPVSIPITQFGVPPVIGGGLTPDFSISASPGTTTFVPGQNVSFTVSLKPINGLTKAIVLKAPTGLPSGATYAYSNGGSVVGEGQAILTIKTPSSAPVGSYTVGIEGDGGGVKHSVAVALTLANARIAIMQNGVLLMKEGLFESFVQETWSAKRFELSGNRIAVLTTDGTLWEKEGLNDSWVNEAGGVSDFHIYGDRTGVVQNGNLSIKDGTLTNSWTSNVASHVDQFALNGDRIAILQSGNLYARDFGEAGPFIFQAGGVTEFQVDGSRLGYLDTSGTLWVKDGDVTTGAVNEAGGVSQFQIWGDRIGVVESGTLYVKEGNLFASSVNEAGGVSQFVLDGTRIGVLQGAIFSVKDGSLTDGWTTESWSAATIQLSGSRIGELDNAGVAWVKDGGPGATFVNEAGGVAQLVLSK